MSDLIKVIISIALIFIVFNMYNGGIHSAFSKNMEKISNVHAVQNKEMEKIKYLK